MKRLTPAAMIMAGAALALIGYLLPWLKISRSRDSWYSGWHYMTSEDGPNWTLLMFVWLAIIVIGGAKARNSLGGAITAVVGAIGALMLSSALVAVSYASAGDRNTLTYVTGMPYGPGMPILAVGLGLVLASAVWSIGLHASGGDTRR